MLARRSMVRIFARSSAIQFRPMPLSSVIAAAQSMTGWPAADSRRARM